MRLLPPAAATLILAVLGISLLDEPIRVTTLLGTALVGLGLVVLSLGGRAPSEAI